MLKLCKSMDCKSLVLAAQHLKVVTHIFQCPGLIISPPAVKVKEIRAEAIRISNMVSLSAHLLSHIPGKLSAATQVIPPAPQFYHCLQGDSHQQQSGLQGSSVPITTHPRKKLSLWRELLLKWNGKPLRDKSDQVTISSDASLLWWERLVRRIAWAELGKFRSRQFTSIV